MEGDSDLWAYPYMVHSTQLKCYTFGRYDAFRYAIYMMKMAGLRREEWLKFNEMSGLLSGDGVITNELSISTYSVQLRKSQIVGDIGHGVGIRFRDDSENRVFYSKDEARAAAMKFEQTRDVPDNMECTVSGKRVYECS